MGQGHGWEGAVLRLLRGKDFVFTVTGAEQVTEHYRRLHLTDGGMLRLTGVHPTMWVRLWFEAAGKPHQRAYTLVDPDPATGTFSLEFALHGGHASDWARSARPGDTIEATVHGTGFTDPDPAPSHLLAIGDPASLPAINSLLTALPPAPATIWFETPPETNGEPAPGLPLRLDTTRHDFRPVPRQDAGAHLLTQVRTAAPTLLEHTPAPYVWIACDTTTTRSLTSYFRKELGLPKQRLHALGFWRP
ncbi:siderophore-interacting protein [Streptomyces adelaidensis]|uniref:siderophore-interacting protein n=1 Tax=Streptomyces adelaidensis TaxID=2796465 RepID=UPI001903C6D7|nr:siderophore-interacting protein [Streptomyces adelaidensis]